jgi:ABC-type nitrate/sulfonate/bicarbonate transport system ATPase subunit
VLLADRVIILGASPGRVRGVVQIDLPRPHAPMIGAIAQALSETKDGDLRADFLLDLIDEHFPTEEADSTPQSTP